MYCEQQRQERHVAKTSGDCCCCYRCCSEVQLASFSYHMINKEIHICFLFFCQKSKNDKFLVQSCYSFMNNFKKVCYANLYMLVFSYSRHMPYEFLLLAYMIICDIRIYVHDAETSL